jgi:hypothetical protein
MIERATRRNGLAKGGGAFISMSRKGLPVELLSPHGLVR